MSCVEKRHVNHRMGSMLHHRFPNGFNDLFMDETDREVSTLTDRAFRSLCVGDDAVYNDEFLYGYSPFSCHKPLVGEPPKKTNKEFKKAGQHKHNKSDAKPWKQQQQKNISEMSSFLKALSVAEESCERLRNGGTSDSNGESWDKSALRSIQRELSEFSSDYHTGLAEGHYKNHLHHQSGDGSSNKTHKDVGLPSGKSTKVKNGKSMVKLKKLNIKNFFLHSEFSPFQTWTDLKQYPFGQDETVTTILSTDSTPKWYDLPFYKELTEAHRKETLLTEEAETGQKEAVEPSSLAVKKPVAPLPPPKIMPKPSATPAEKRCSSNGGDGTAAPWRRNSSRAKSALPVNQPGIPHQESNAKAQEESLLFLKKEVKSVEVKAVEEVSSVASTPFSICQLMTPLIPSRQPTETSEILQAVLSPSALDLPGRPHSEAKSTPEVPVKRENYKSLASSILFNLKDNRKRVKSRYSPPKFKTLELPEGDDQSSQSDNEKQAGSEGSGSGLSTPAISRDGLPVCSPILEPTEAPDIDLTQQDGDKPLSDDYLLSNLLHDKRDENPLSPFKHSKMNKSPMAKKQNYPSLNLYKKASPVDSDMKYLQVPLSTNIDPPTETKDRDFSPRAQPKNTGFSSSTSNAIKDYSSLVSPHTLEKERLSSDGKIPPNVPEKTKRVVKDARERDIGVLSTSKEKETGGQTMSTMEVIRAAKEAINIAKNKARSASHSDSISKRTSDAEEQRQKEKHENVSKDMFRGKRENLLPESDNILSQNRNEVSGAVPVGKNSKVGIEPPPVPKKNFAKSDVRLSHDKSSNGDLVDIQSDLPQKEKEPVQNQSKHKHIFSARLNNYIKHQRYAGKADEKAEECEEGNLNVNTRMQTDDESQREIRDSGHIINDLQALKELERARLGDHVHINPKSKQQTSDIEEEAKAKNDMISRELRNIKRGMLSMRGNTSAKREMFANKEKEQRKQETFTKLDSNVIVNKALINDNYDKAKMALEEVISERKRKKNESTGLRDGNPASEENVNDKCSETWPQQGQKVSRGGIREVSEKQNGSTPALKHRELKERLGDLRDHNQLRQILSQTEPRPGDTHGSGGRIALPGVDRTTNELNSPLKAKTKHVRGPCTDTRGSDVSLKGIARQVSEESGEYLTDESEDKRPDAPPVPPRSRKGANKRAGSRTKEKDAVEKTVLNKDEKFENYEEHLPEIRTGSGEQDIGSEEAVHSQTENSLSTCKPVLSSNFTTSENVLLSSPELRTKEPQENDLQFSMSPTREATTENISAKAQETCRIRRKAPLKPDHLSTTDENMSRSLKADEEAFRISNEDANVEPEVLGEVYRNIVSPLLLVNGVSVTQSPPDQGSLSSKSSYFSVESTLHRNTETESNVYHSLENLSGEDEEVEVGQSFSPKDSSRPEMEYNYLGDPEKELEVMMQPIKSPLKDIKVQPKDRTDNENIFTDKKEPQKDNDATTTSPTNTFSPTLGIPALFKVKDNSFANKLKKAMPAWSPRGSLIGSEKVGEEVTQGKANPGPIIKETSTSDSTVTVIETFKPKEIISSQSPLPVLSPSSIQSENPKKTDIGSFLTVPQEEDRSSRVTPLSEGVESLPTSQVETVEEVAMTPGVLVESEETKVLSERSGSTCSGNDSQTGLPKPPAVLPKSEKAIQKAIRLTNRRIKKEEAQKLPQKSSQSSSKHKADRHKSDKSEQKSSSTSTKSGKSGDKKHSGKPQDYHQHSQSHGSNDINAQCEPQLSCDKSHHNMKEVSHKSRRRSNDSVENYNQTRHGRPSEASERQGRSSERHARQNPEQRHCSSDRVISNVPVYKAHVGERPPSDRPFNRSQSIDRYLGGNVQRRLSADVSVNEKLDPRAERIEKSIMDELQQRGRAKDKGSRDNPLRRSHSIDAYSTEVRNPSSLSRQSSHSSQLSRQSSIEHAIVTQSFPMTQRKLLQDPDSGRCFFVDLPVQVKTKTFFDPETGSYVQLPIQPPEGAFPQASTMEVLTPPLMVYHGFVPVSLSPMAQKTAIQAHHVEPEEFEQRHLDRTRQMHCREGHPYLEPPYGQHDHMLGEFMGTEELDCPS